MTNPKVYKYLLSIIGLKGVFEISTNASITSIQPIVKGPFWCCLIASKWNLKRINKIIKI